MSSSIAQPLFGALGDRYPMRWLLPVGVGIAGLGLTALLISPLYWVTVGLVAISGVGVAAFHPASARVARELSGGSHVVMSWYSLGGNLGFASSPIIVALTVGLFGLGTSPLLGIPAAVGVLAALLVIRSRALQSGARDLRASIQDRPDDWLSFGLLSGAIALRSIVFFGLSSFIAVFAVQRIPEAPEWITTAALLILYSGAAVGTVIGGYLARRWSRITVMRWSYALSSGAVAGVVVTPGPVMLAFVAIASLGLYLSFSLNVTLGQDYLPRHMGTASGVTLGLTISIGGLFAPVIGALADRVGLQLALAPLVLLPLLSILFLARLKDPRYVSRGSPSSEQRL